MRPRKQALVSDSDRIEAARLVAERLYRFLLKLQPRWSHYFDSAGAVFSVGP